MIERLTVYGVPMSMVALAYVTMPDDDERIEVPVSIGYAEDRTPVLCPDWDGVLEAVEARRLAGRTFPPRSQTVSPDPDPGTR